MGNARQLKSDMKAGLYEDTFRLLYDDSREAALRYEHLIDDFVSRFGDGELRLFSAPGRTEIGGNHTDHQHGRVLAGAVNLDIIAVARQTEASAIHLHSPDYGEISVDLSQLLPRPEEEGTSAALIRGMAAGFEQRGLPVCGFDACIDSEVHAGSGLSSSAAFETLIGVILRELAGVNLGAKEIAILAQQAENRWFNKPCGLMDQTACAAGGFVAIDFSEPGNPQIEQLDFDFAASDYALCITGPIGSHADLTHAYAAIPEEMGQVARLMGKHHLREVSPERFFEALPQLLGQCPDRALLRAMHFFDDNDRVPRQAEALRHGDFAEFLRLVRESGRSSYQYLQNVYHKEEQRMAIALAESNRILGETGACRIHGGGFAGTIQAFVPLVKAKAYQTAMDRLFGSGSCRQLSIRPVGITAIEREVTRCRF